MDQQPDVQKQQQEQHQSIQDQPNIVYIQQDPQNFRNSNYSYLNEGQNNLIGNQSFQQQNVNFGQFDNFYSFLSNGHFPPSNTSATIIQNSVDVNKCKNASEILKNSQFLSDNDSNNCHQRNEATLQLANANYQSVDLPGLNYQQASQFFLQNLGNQYQLNDILVPAYQSSGSSESSDESSISNISQQHYPGGSSGLSNNQFEFPVPISSTGQLGRNFQQFQQKDFLDNYMALLQQENQIPRCDSSKSEAAESTCSSLSSGSIESQSENENVVRLPVLVNSLVSDNENCNILQSYQTNTQNNIATYSNQMHQNQTNEIVNQRNYNSQSEQNLVKCTSSYPNTINANNVMNSNIGNVNDVLPPNNQLNNLVVMLPNRINKNIQNCLTTNQSMIQNPSSPDTLSASKFILQNQKVNQQRLFGLINVENQIHEDKMNLPSQLNESLKLNNSLEENSSGSSDLISRNGENNIQSCGNYSSDEDRNNRSVNNGCSAAMVHSVNNHANSDDGNDTSPFQKTSDSSVISSNFFQSNFSTKSIENDNNNSAMLFKETSDKDMSQCINDVNSSVADTKDVYLIKNDESDIAKNVCYNNDTSAASCLTTNSTINGIPVPVGWRRLLLEGSIIYLSPSNVALSSIDQVKLYLQTKGTCKCGLECPVNCDSVFNFNPKVISRPWDSSDSELTRLCNHKRKAPPIPVPSVTGVDKNTKSSRKDVIPMKRKKKRHGSGGISVSKLLAQRESAMTAAVAARWSANSQPGNVSYQNVPTNQYQGIQVLRNQTQDRQQVPYESQVTDGFKQEHPGPVRLPDDKTAQFPCINVVNAPGRDGNMVNVNGLNQMVPENHATKHELMRTSQVTQNSVSNQRRDMSQGVIGHPVSYNQIGQEFLQNAVVAPRPDGVVLAPQGMLFPPNMIMQRPRSIPPWHQARLGLNKKSVPETPVVYERIPCVQQHMPPSTLVFEDPPPRKKHKSSSKTKKTSPPEPRQKSQPSFMDNPSAYLAQQTALLHNTISRPNFGLIPDTHPPNKLPQKLSNSSSTSERNTLGPLKSNSSSSKSTYRSHSSQKRDHQTSFSRVHTYSKSNSDKRNIRSGEVSSGTNSNELQNFTDVRFNNHVCSNSNCVECKKSRLFESSSGKSISAEKQRNEKMKLIQENLQKSKSEIYSKQKYSKNDWKRKESAVSHHRRKSSLTNEDQSSSIEENPVTSTTERAPATYHQRNVSDSRPIQGGTVSTSNGSPQPQPSPNSSNIFKQDVSSPKSELPSHSPGTGNILISSSTNSSLAISNSVGSSLLRDNETVGQVKLENPDRKDNFDTSHYGNVNQKPLSPDDSLKYKYSNSNFASVTTTCDQKFQRNADGTEEQSKSQSVTSTFDLQKEDEKKSKNSETKGNRLVRTAASGHTVSSNTITSVQAGKTQTTTVTVNNNSSTPPAISVVNFANQNMLNVPLVPKGNSQTKTPLEMVQSVVSSIQTSKNVPKNEVQPNIVSVNKAVLPTSNVLNNILTSTANINTPILASNNPGAAPVLKTSPGGLQAGHILVSSNGQYIVASSGNIIPQTNLGGLKLNTPSPMPPMSASPVVTNVTGAVTQVLPAVGVAQQVLGQPTVLVNTLPAPFVIQPGVMAVDTGLGRLAVAGNVLQSSLIENNPLRNSMRGLNPSEKSKSKKGNKKRKSQVPSLVQMTSPNNVIINQPFGQQNFAVSPGGNVQPLQALTLVQGKHGGPTQIVMNNQNNFNQFSPQPQQINLLQPVNLASVSNFPAFQQFIVPSLGNMVMSTDGTTTILPDTTNIGVQLQLQNVNGQNVLTPVQNTGFLNGQGILTTPAGMLIRAPNNQQKIIQNNSNPQFLSPNSGQFLVNQFQGQLSPLIAANLSPNQQIFTSSPPRQSPQEFIQIIPSSSSQNTTVVQQNTTIVQQQTTMVSNNQNILNNSGKSNFILNNSNVEKPVEVQIVGGTSQRQSQQSQQQPQPQPQQPPSQFQQQQQSQKNLSQEKVDTGTQHSVSTQTIVSKEGNNVSVATNNTFCQTLNSNWSGSPPDTTTHSPLESESNRERTQSPSTDESPEDSVPQAMVQYVSSSMNESESENETYILPSGLPKMLTNCEGLPKSNDKAKNIVESSTILQEAGVQIQIGTNCTSSRNQKTAIDECVVSSHSDVNAQDKHTESHSNVARYQDDKARLVNALLTETRSDDLGEEGIVDVKEKLAEGDLVWGSVRGFPAWPGKLVGPISPGGRVLVRWFGGHSSPTRVNVSQLQSLSQGLDAHHRASNKGRKNRRLNIELEAAIQEAMLELDKMAARQKKISTGGSARLRRSHR